MSFRLQILYAIRVSGSAWPECGHTAKHKGQRIKVKASPAYVHTYCVLTKVIKLEYKQKVYCTNKQTNK